jgi:hypothetical protein
MLRTPDTRLATDKQARDGQPSIGSLAEQAAGIFNKQSAQAVQ